MDEKIVRNEIKKIIDSLKVLSKEIPEMHHFDYGIVYSRKKDTLLAISGICNEFHVANEIYTYWDGMGISPNIATLTLAKPIGLRIDIERFAQSDEEEK